MFSYIMPGDLPYANHVLRSAANGYAGVIASHGEEPIGIDLLE